MCNFVIYAVLMQNGKSMIFYDTPPRTPPTPPRHSNVWSFSKRNISPNFSFGNRSRDFPSLHFRDPPPLPHTLEMLHNNLLIFYKLIWFTNILQPRGHREFCVWGPLQAQWRTPQTNQPLRRVQIFLWGVLSRFEGGGSPKCFLGKTLSPPMHYVAIHLSRDFKSF